MFTTNPKKVFAPKSNSGVSAVDKLLSFNTIEYPDLNNGFIASPSPASSANTSIEPTTNGDSNYPSNGGSNYPSNGGSSYPSNGGPIYPANGGPLYPSTKDLSKNAAILSGALTISKVPNNIQSKF